MRARFIFHDIYYVSEVLQFIGLRLAEPMPRRAYASERITLHFAAILLVSRMAPVNWRKSFTG